MVLARVELGVLDIDRDDAGAAGGFGGLESDRADHADAHDDYGVTEFDGRDGDGVDADGDGFDEGGLLVGEGVRQLVHDAAGHGDEFGEGAVAAVFFGGDADHLAVVAEVDVAAHAEEAFAAVDGGIEGDAVADGEVMDVGAEAGDFSGGFVAHDEGRMAAAGRAVVAVDIAATDSTGADADEDVVGADLRLGHFDHFELEVFG